MTYVFRPFIWLFGFNLTLYIFVSLSDSWSFVIRTEGFRYCSYFIQIVHAISVLMIWLLSIYLFLLSVPRWFWNCFPFCRTICEWLCSYIGFNTNIVHWQGESEAKSSKNEESNKTDTKDDTDTEVTEVEGNENTSGDELHLVEGGKKDPFLRRQELLVNSGLAEVCYFTFWNPYLHFVFIWLFWFKNVSLLLF